MNYIEHEGTTYKIEGQFFVINNKKIPLESLYNFTYDDANFNGSGNVYLNIKCKESSDIVISSSEFTLFQTANAAAQADAKRQKIISILDMLYPFIMKTFIAERIKLLQEGKTFTLCKMRFSKSGITMRPRVYFWLTEIFVPYKYAFIETIYRKIGLSGVKGYYQEFRLENYMSNEVHKYSISSYHQPKPSDVLKAKELVNYIVQNNLF